MDTKEEGTLFVFSCYFSGELEVHAIMPSLKMNYFEVGTETHIRNL